MGVGEMVGGPHRQKFPTAAEEAARANAFGAPILSFADLPDGWELAGFAWQGIDGRDVRGTSIYKDPDGNWAAEFTTWLRAPEPSNDRYSNALQITAIEFISSHDPSQQHIDPEDHDRFQDEVKAVDHERAVIVIDDASVAATEVRWENLHIYEFELNGTLYTAGTLIDLAEPSRKLTTLQFS